MAESKKNFTITVREIENGFLVKTENKDGVEWEERFCPDQDEIIDQIRVWTDKMFKESG